MIAPSHAIIAVATAVAFTELTAIYPTPPEIIFLLIGSLAPDIDGGGSITRPSKAFRGLLFRPAGKLIDRIGSGISGLIRGTFGHRGFFHWPIVAAALFAIGFYIHSGLLFWFTLGYLSHILADSLTVSGIPFFAPITNRCYSVRLFRTGSWREFIFVGIIAIVTAYFGFSLLPSKLQIEIHSIINKTKLI